MFNSLDIILKVVVRHSIIGMHCLNWFSKEVSCLNIIWRVLEVEDTRMNLKLVSKIKQSRQGKGMHKGLEKS